MMIDKRLIGTVNESKKYIVGNVIFQWCSLIANILMMMSITQLFAKLLERTIEKKSLITIIIIAAAAIFIRFLCAIGSSQMSYLSSKAVKKTLREQIYEKLLKLGASYKE